jgi:hypothetical protein
VLCEETRAGLVKVGHGTLLLLLLLLLLMVLLLLGNPGK